MMMRLIGLVFFIANKSTGLCNEADVCQVYKVPLPRIWAMKTFGSCGWRFARIAVGTELL